MHAFAEHLLLALPSPLPLAPQKSKDGVIGKKNSKKKAHQSFFCSGSSYFHFRRAAFSCLLFFCSGSSYFHFRRAAFSCLLKSKCGNILAKASALRVNLNLDGVPIASNSHTHPSYSQTSRLLTSSLSLGVPVPRPTQCMGWSMSMHRRCVEPSALLLGT